MAHHDAQVSVNGCHPSKSITYNLCDGLVAVDYGNKVYLLGLRGVPLIPQSVGVLLSELQARAHGIIIDSVPRIFGGEGRFTIDGSIHIPLHLEHGLMTCPVRKPTVDEVNTLQVLWLTGEHAWDPSIYDEVSTSKILVPQGYASMPSHGNIHLSRSSPKLPDPQLLSKYLLYRPIDIINHTLQCTTRLATSIDDMQFCRHFKSRFPFFNRPRLQETYATDTWFANTRAIGGFTCAQLFYGTTTRFIVLYPMKREGDGPTILQDFIRDHGSPFVLRNDNSQMQSGHLWTSICRKYNIRQTFTEPNHPRQNPAERYIGHVKDLVIKILDRTGAPDSFWALCGSYVVYILNRMAHPLLDNWTPFERRHGYTPDISAILHFGFWDPIYFFDSETSFPQSRERAGHFVGLTESIGDALTYWVDDDVTHQLLARSFIRQATVPNNRVASNGIRIRDHSVLVSDRVTPLLVGHQDLVPDKPLVEFDPMDHSGFPSQLDDPISPTTPSQNPSNIHTTSSVNEAHPGSRISVYWPDDDKYYDGVITRMDKNGSKCTITYDDGDIERLDLRHETITIPKSTIPTINLDANPDTNGKLSTSSSSSLLDLNSMPDTDDVDRWKMLRILDHKEIGPYKTEFKIQWDSGETTWLPLSIVKRSDPNLFTGYALTARGPWANTFRNQRRHLHQLCSNIFKTSTVLYKYGFRLPRSSKEAFEIDKSNGNTLWATAINKEMFKIEQFNVFKESSSVPTGYERLRCMLIFDIKLDGTHKARLVADGSGSPASTDSYSSVISPDHVRLALIAAALNVLDHSMIDLENAYLHALTKELAYTYLPLEFGNLCGKTLIFHKALYGMRTSGACFHTALSKVLLSMNFLPSRADPDLWFRVHNGTYEYIVRYVDDLLIFAHCSKDIVAILQTTFSVRIGSSNLFLGGDISFHDGCPFTSAKTYITNTCKKVESLCSVELQHYDSPMATDDHPELDDTSPLDPQMHSIYRFLVGACQWIIILGRMDILHAVSALSHFSQLPHKGHLTRMLRVFGYLKFHSTLGISMVPTVSSFPTSSTEFIPQQWREQYPHAAEDIPTDVPTPLGRPIILVAHVDASHASNLINRRSVTGFVILANGVPIY